MLNTSDLLFVPASPIQFLASRRFQQCRHQNSSSFVASKTHKGFLIRAPSQRGFHIIVCQSKENEDNTNLTNNENDPSSPQPSSQDDSSSVESDFDPSELSSVAPSPGFRIPNPIRDLFSFVRRLAGVPPKPRTPLTTLDLNFLRDDPAAAPPIPTSASSTKSSPTDTSLDDVPEVLVVGATGETGRIIVRKLLLRGYKVRVLVRNLYSGTLDLLGTGVGYIKGDIRDYSSLAEAVGGVDKVICAVRKNDEVVGKEESTKEVEYFGVRNVIRAFEDSRLAFYGRNEATKLLLFNFKKRKHLVCWKPFVRDDQGQQEKEKEKEKVGASVGFGTAGAAFGGDESMIGFDTVWGGDENIVESDSSQQTAFETRKKPPRISFGKTDSGRTAFLGQVYDVYSGEAEVRCIPANFNLKGFSGLILRCIGNGKRYSVVLRTPEAAKINVLYKMDFKTVKGRWLIVRLPFSEFRPVNATTSQRRSDAPELDRRQIRQIGFKFKKPEESPEKDDGRFYLAVEYLKTYRTQEEPDFVLVSCASVSTRDFSNVVENGINAVREDDSTGWKYLAEKALRNSGLTYTIVRAGQFTEQAGGNKALMLEQSGDVSGAISRADVAEVCVKSLLDPRACNVTFDVFESMYAPTARTRSENLSALLGQLRPNT